MGVPVVVVTGDPGPGMYVGGDKGGGYGGDERGGGGGGVAGQLSQRGIIQ